MSNPKLTGIVVTPYDNQYQASKTNYNLSIPKEPCIIVYCLNEQDVINAIVYAKFNDIDFRIRSGRHDFEANSNIDGGLVIDISKIKYVEIDEDNLTAKVGGGILFGEIYSELVNRGYTIPGGTCADVGATGLTTVGGVGYATRYLGLTCDNLIEATIINNYGQKLIVNENSNKDLFWAIKGASASSFGIVTSMKYKIHKVNKVCFIVTKWDKKDFMNIIDTFQNVAYNTDNRLSLNMELTKDKDDKVSLTIDGQFFGKPQELLELMKVFLDKADPIYFDLKYIPYEESIKIWEEGCFPPNKFKNSGSFIYETMSRSSIEKIIEYVEEAPKGFIHYLELISLGGQVQNISKDSASFAHRDARFLAQIKSIWDTRCQAEDSKQWTNDFKRFLDTIGIGNYRGFTDFNIANWQYQYYRENYTQLQIVKDIYDSQNLFKYYQGIQPTKYSYEGLTGKVITKESADYNQLRKNYNLYFDYYPVVIVYAQNVKDIKNAVKWANENYINITIRCGGHNYESFSVSNYSLLLDVSNLRKLELDSKNNLVTIGSGYNLGSLYNDLYNLGYQFTGGTCPGVGISGLVSGGGVGLSSRLYGLACDNLVQLKLIDAYGEEIVANDCRNSDLFWACRGAGGANFGVFYEFTFKVRPVDKITYISISWPKEQRYEVINEYQKYMLNADERISLELTVTNSLCKIDGFSYARLEETKKLMQPILSIANQTSTIVEYIPFIDAVKNVGKTQLPPNRFKNSSGYIKELLPPVAIDKILYNLDNAPTSGFAHSVLFIPLTGKVQQNKNLNTSYAHRDAKLLIQYVSRWNQGDDANVNIEWIERFRKDMIMYAYYGYVNFPDIDIVDYLRAYYVNSTDCLIDIKNKYNPSYIFQFPQSL